MPVGVNRIYRVIVAICEHIIAEHTCTSGSVCIRVDKSTNSGVVITALQIIESGISVVLVATWDIKVKSQHRRYHDYILILVASLLVVKRTMAVIRKFCQLVGPLLSEFFYGIAWWMFASEKPLITLYMCRHHLYVTNINK